MTCLLDASDSMAGTVPTPLNTLPETEEIFYQMSHSVAIRREIRNNMLRLTMHGDITSCWCGVAYLVEPAKTDGSRNTRVIFQIGYKFHCLAPVVTQSRGQERRLQSSDHIYGMVRYSQ